MKTLQELKVPQESVNDKFLNVVGIPFKNGDKVHKDNVVLELETSKAVVTLEAECDGYIEYLCKMDDEVAVNTPVVIIWDEKKITSSSDTIVEKHTGANVSSLASSLHDVQGEYETLFSSKALEQLSDNNLSKELFKHLDFVTETTIKEHLGIIVKPETIKSVKPEPQKLDFEKISLHKINSSKKREIDYLSDVQSAGLVSIINIDLDVEGIFESVNDHLQYFKGSILPIIIYECSRLLIQYPVFNSYYTNQGIASYNNVHIGVAMDIDDGLKVVKLADTNKLSLHQVEEKLYELANKYIDRKLGTADLVDITFTITDLSSFGAYSFSPLINKNNAAILGISKVDTKLNRVILSFAFDHRVTEGKMAAIFLQELKSRFESYCFNLKKEFSIKNVFCYKCLKTLEQDLNDTGFIKMINKNGENRYICDLCLLNF